MENQEELKCKKCGGIFNVNPFPVTEMRTFICEHCGAIITFYPIEVSRSDSSKNNL